VQPSRNDSDSAAPGSSALPVRLGRSFAALALALLAALPIWSFFGVETVPAARLLVAGMAAVSVVSPVSGLLWCAGLLPLTGPLSAVLGSAAPYSLGEPLVLAFLAGWLLRIAVRPGAPAGAARRAVLAPALALAVVVVASAAVQLYAVQPVSGQSRPPAVAAFHFAVTDYFRDRSTSGAIPAAAFVLEGLGLFVATLLIGGRVKALGARLLAMVSFGAVGVSALSVVRLVTVSLRKEDVWAALANYLQTIRISAAFPDPNAAGSYLAMCLLTAVGAAIASSVGGAGPNRDTPGRSAGLLALAAIPAVAAGLWLTGSRAALLAVIPASALLVPLALRAPRRLRGVGAGLVVLVVLLSLPFLPGRFNPPEVTGRSLSLVVGFRTEMTRMALRMIAAQPVFGVGVGRLHARSGGYFTPEFRAAVPRENAHNNFLQVLGELGIVGFVPFVWALWAVARAVALSSRAGTLPAPAVGGAAGLAAFVLTWLTGHPLLIFEVATAFWLVLGAVAALAVAGDPAWPAGRSTRRRASEWFAILLAAATIASVPFRGQ
jgi:O-antigen ligase